MQIILKPTTAANQLGSAIREAAAGIFVWPAWGLYDPIKGEILGITRRA